MVDERRKDVWQVQFNALRTEVVSLREEIMVLKAIGNELIRLRNMTEEHDKILVRGNGKPSMQEDVRNLLTFVKSLRWWMTAIAVAFLGQFIAVGISMVVTIIRLEPLLEKILLSP